MRSYEAYRTSEARVAFREAAYARSASHHLARITLPGENHGAARSGEYNRYGQRKQFDFFVQHLLGIKPPDWNMSTTKPRSTSQQ